jgi:hypothetical protein
MQRARAAAPWSLLLLWACAARWVAADPEHGSLPPCCTGSVVAVAEEPGGGVLVTIRPEADGRRLLAEGQELLPCFLYADDRRRSYQHILPMVVPGARIRICGYFVLDRSVGRNELRPVTCINPYPEPPK